MSIVDEIWKDVVGFEGYYQVSNLGRVRSLDRTVDGVRQGTACKLNLKGKVLVLTLSTGYYGCALNRDNIAYFTHVHALVARMFLGDRPKGFDINHIDGNRLNNCVSNLEYCSHRDNSLHAFRTGMCDHIIGGNHYRAKLTECDIPLIRQRIASGESMVAIGRDYGVNRGAIAKIKCGRNWKHIK